MMPSLPNTGGVPMWTFVSYSPGLVTFQSIAMPSAERTIPVFSRVHLFRAEMGSVMAWDFTADGSARG